MYRYLIVILLLVIQCCCGCQNNSTAIDQARLERIASTHNIELIEFAGEPALMIGGERITVDDLIFTPVEFTNRLISPAENMASLAGITTLEQFKERTKPTINEILTSRITNIILYHYAREEFGNINEEALQQAAETQLRKFEMNYDGDLSAVDEQLKQLNLDRDGFIEQQKKALLIQSYVSSQLQVSTPITYRELKEQYEKMKNNNFAVIPLIQFSLIDIQPAKLIVSEPNQTPEETAKVIATELMVRLDAGEDFAELARQYSNGPMASIGGQWRALQPDSLAAPYDWIAEAAQQTEPGQIAELRITPEHIFIMRLDNKQSGGYIPFEEVQQQVRSALIISRRSDIITKINTRITEQTNLGQADKFVDFCLEKIYQHAQQQS